MEFKKRYISFTENSVKADPKKIVISDDAYAISELLDELVKNQEASRLASIR
ncbi:hypothetical protein LCGC14_2781660 [marine sediment metagenome]|uniref:Uncharacterized protein n=1 Tax=marine sediment metagenome TaxID=412755 RepID=A0A0F8ZF76_9ZZZZ